MPLRQNPHLRFVTCESDEAKSLGLASLDILFNLSHQDLSIWLKIFPEFWFGCFPWKTQDDQIGALVLLHLLVLGGRALLMIVRFAFIG